MIRTVADLLNALKEKERLALSTYGDVRHNGMVGDMYEGLTRSLLNRVVFDGLDLRVATGKIRAPDGSLSRQIDAMVAVGAGDRMPYTEHDIYPVERVIAVVEVKKRLYSSAMSEAYDNLLSLSSDSFVNLIPVDRLQHAFRRITHRDFPEDGDVSVLPWDLEFYAHALVHEVSLPVRIVFGYEGYANEKTLRDGFLNYLGRVAQSGPRRGYGPAQLPNLILCGGNALVKLNALPYSAQHGDPDWWLVYSSSSGHAALLLLEVLWTRLVSQFDLTSEVFGEDLEIERLNPLLLTRPTRVGDSAGWMYRSHEMTLEELQASPAFEPWEPLRLSNAEATIISILCTRLSIGVRTDPLWADFLKAEGDALPDFLERARLAGIAALVDDHFTLLTDRCQVACLPDIGFVVGENSTGRFTRWLLAQGTHRNPD